MCGLTGLLARKSGDELESSVRRMADTLFLRGPDDHGTWVDESNGIALGHRRLAILDLSAAGHQPMLSQSGRFAIAFNGEIYNHKELRAELAFAGAAPQWRGQSDTETLLAAFQWWGFEATLSRCVGMFAIALWDLRDRTLYLARDRFGEKPLYYGWLGDAFAFGSELKALRAYKGFSNSISREALAQYLRFNYVPAPRTIYRDIYKLEPGTYLVLAGSRVPPPPAAPLRPGDQHETIRVDRYWSFSDAIEAGAEQAFSDEEAVLRELEVQLQEAVRAQSLADVPLGAFLSGGVDSSTIVALMQLQARASGGPPVKTFTVGFDDPAFDESAHAKAVARHLDTDHYEMFVTAADARAVIPQLPTLFDEPFADSSQIPTHLVCRAARQHVTVALSGDAGDELFGGYNRYFWGPRIWSRIGWMPFPARRLLGAAISKLPVGVWDSISVPWNRLAGADGAVRLGDKAHKLAARLQSVKGIDDLYLSLVSEWRDPASLVVGEGAAIREPPSLLDDPLPARGASDEQLRMMYRDSISYLPDDILCKVDRAAMGVSLETRVPFLDHRVVEAVWRMPLHMRIRGNVGKWALRQILYKYVPHQLIERPKAGFGIPVGQWLRGPLRDWAEALLDPDRMAREGYLKPEPVRGRWAEHLSGRRDYTPSLWAILMFQAWLESTR
jgi:asparagine synthase (glutamine-hydrolysing)